MEAPLRVEAGQNYVSIEVMDELGSQAGTRARLFVAQARGIRTIGDRVGLGIRNKVRFLEESV